MTQRKRVLIVDDDDMIADLIHRILTSVGYIVDKCSDGDDAIQQYARSLECHEPYQVVILDMHMGNKRGDEVLCDLYRYDKNVVAICCTGNIMDVDHEKSGFAGIIQKPFNVKKLKESVESALAATATAIQ